MTAVEGARARDWHAAELSRYIGRRIVAVRPLSDLEIASEQWDDCDPGLTVAVILDNGSVLIPHCDRDGNGPGYLRQGHLVR